MHENKSTEEILSSIECCPKGECQPLSIHSFSFFLSLRTSATTERNEQRQAVQSLPSVRRSHSSVNAAPYPLHTPATSSSLHLLGNLAHGSIHVRRASTPRCLVVVSMAQSRHGVESCTNSARTSTFRSRCEWILVFRAQAVGEREKIEFLFALEERTTTMIPFPFRRRNAAMVIPLRRRRR